jgi:hypothetical protein
MKEKVPGIFVKRKDPEKDPDYDPYLWVLATSQHPCGEHAQTKTEQNLYKLVLDKRDFIVLSSSFHHCNQ